MFGTVDNVTVSYFVLKLTILLTTLEHLYFILTLACIIVSPLT